MSIELFKEGIKKCWILPLILTIVLALMVPIYILTQKDTINEGAKNFEQLDTTAANLEQPVELNLTGAYKELAGATIIYNPYVMLTILILPIVLGVQLFGSSKKNKNRLADFIQEKGLNKNIVYRTNILTGIVLSIAPILVSAILLILIKLFAGMGDYITVKVLLNWISIGIFASILFFVFTALVGFITKNRVLQVLYTYGLLFIPVFLVYLFEIFMTKVIYGFPGFTTGVIEFLNQVPAIKVCQMFTTQYVNYTLAHAVNLWYVLVYLIITAIIIYIGQKLIKYELAKPENQEKLQKVGDKIFKYIWIFALGMLLYVAFMLSYSNSLVSILTVVALYLIVYILKEVITKKNIKAILNGKHYYIMSAVVVVLVVLLSSDLFGYEKSIPNIEEIEYMTYTAAYPNKTGEIEFRNEESIKNLIEKHKNFILEKNVAKDITTDKYTKIYLQYKLKNGKYVVRSYETILPVDEPLFATEEYIKQKYNYMYDKKDDIDILKIAGIYNNKTFIFEANKYEHQDLLNEIITYISNDLINNNVHIPPTDEYQQYTEKEGIQLMQIGLLDGMNQYTSYLYYLKVEPSYELVQKMQNLIDEESEFITWVESSN